MGRFLGIILAFFEAHEPEFTETYSNCLVYLNLEFLTVFPLLGDFVDASADSFYIAVWKQIMTKLLSDCV